MVSEEASNTADVEMKSDEPVGVDNHNGSTKESAVTAKDADALTLEGT